VVVEVPRFETASGPALDEGGAAGIGSFLDSFKTAALNILNYTTYYEMKTRAGKVGNNGAAPLIDNLAAKVDRIHLIGHSFGGRLVTAAAKESTTNKLASLTLLQAAFSHNGFSKILKGFFRSVVEAKRVSTGKFFNLRGDSFIKDHGDVTGKQIVNAGEFLQAQQVI
jgi:hypothetical protein